MIKLFSDRFLEACSPDRKDSMRSLRSPCRRILSLFFGPYNPLFPLILLVAMSGCTSHFIYNNLDWLIYWYVDDYVELSGEQKADLEPQLHEFLGWHRQEALPDYLALLEKVGDEVNNDPISPAQIENWLVEVRHFWLSARLAAQPMVIQAAATLNDQQVNELVATIEGEIAEKRQELKAQDSKQRQERRLERIQKRFEDWLGTLSDAQQQQLSEHVGHLQSDYSQWLDYRARWTKSLEHALNLRVENPAAFELALQDLIRRPQALKSPQHRSDSARDRARWFTFIAQTLSTLSKDQRQHLLDQLADLKADIRSLLAE